VTFPEGIRSFGVRAAGSFLDFALLLFSDTFFLVPVHRVLCVGPGFEIALRYLAWFVSVSVLCFAVRKGEDEDEDKNTSTIFVFVDG
jgi:hypothetical protein